MLNKAWAMNSKDISKDIMKEIIEEENFKELPHFEVFFSRIGLKRIDGSIYGLLVMAKKPLSSEEIEQTLNLSQSAVSLSLKTLSHFGAIESIGDRENPGTKAKLHLAKEDSLAVVASVFRKREQEMVADFKSMAIRILDKSQTPDCLQRKKRMQSIISTCDIAESVMSFVIQTVQSKMTHEHAHHYETILKKLPKALELLSATALPLADMTQTIKENLTKKIQSNFKGIYEKR